jgi:hypothetical protein
VPVWPLKAEREVVHPCLWMPKRDEPELQELGHQVASPANGDGASSVSRAI